MIDRKLKINNLLLKEFRLGLTILLFPKVLKTNINVKMTTAKPRKYTN